MTAIVQNVVTSGVFELDGGSWDVDNNVWLIGDDEEVLVIDAAHDAARIEDAIGERKVVAIVCTHAHNDHVNAAPELASRTGAPILLHPEDRVLWDLTHADRAPDGELADGQELTVAGTRLKVIHTPGHAPGAVCLYAADLGTVFTGDTLFNGGPGATGRSYSDYPTIRKSIQDKLFVLPEDTRVNTGHGGGTTIGDEKSGSAGWD
ncbi:MBL fold metallo-hydrolase [Amycolatopsis magusensis]|uniref:Glyoxylase-like metal-dependent hydrolase (Beta-lactamase superfamily II) n=1 Tax=Amycolatopsis magusensis TaxID=882444 RepID=A0ABS4PH64_9PSEU|nr:MBL fold metallo-hydrolase [Amycolatopsis magusensis]MBP2178754.1 glyoxylase-like metal-dependent hydrolase (beta-lactamase superfamily II) [Amycolatopsis magusensis]MDI5982343.1 MBL fold metallo-hydrolase [Amycolatopsis magusensis]